MRKRRRSVLSEGQAWVVALCLPAAILASIACYAAAAGCYSVWMNCFSVVEPDSWVTHTMFFAAKLVPFALPTYSVFALAGLVVLRRVGTKPLERWLWVGPALFVAALHAACVGFAWTALPERQLHPTASFDAIALATAYGYAGFAQVASGYASRRRASSR